MPRIAIILGRLVIGGTTTDTLQAARYLQHNHELLLITGKGGKDELEAIHLIHQLPNVRHESVEGFSGTISPLSDWMAYRRIRKTLLKFQPDVVHTHTAKAGLIGRLAAWSAKVPAIVHTYHGMLFHGYYNRYVNHIVIQLERWLAGKTTCIIALSTAQKQQLTDEYQIAASGKIRIIPLGIEIKNFTADQLQKRTGFRRRFLLQDHEVAVGIIGRIVPIKNHYFFLQVVQQVLQKNLPVRFFIIGDGPLRRQLQERSNDMRIESTFFPDNPVCAPLTFTSWITDIDEAISGLDIINLTSINEGTPVSLIEAQAAGRPVVVCKAGGINDIMVHGTTGYSVEQGDLTRFVHYLQELIVSKTLRDEMGKAGALFAARNFQKQRQANDLDSLYLQLTTGSNR